MNFLRKAHQTSRKAAKPLIGLLLGIPFIVSCGAMPIDPSEYPLEYKQDLPYMVRIQDSMGTFRGTGFIVSNKGLALTVSHVVRYRTPARTIYKNKLYNSTIEFDDPVLDITLIRIPVKEQIPDNEVPCLWNEDTVKSGDFVTILGQRHQGGVAEILGNMISYASFRIWPGSYKEVMRIHPSDRQQSPRPGFSGGPIFDAKRLVIGLFCCLEDRMYNFYNGIPSKLIIERLEGSGLLEEMCITSKEQFIPLPGFIYDTKSI